MKRGKWTELPVLHIHLGIVSKLPESLGETEEAEEYKETGPPETARAYCNILMDENCHIKVEIFRPRLFCPCITICCLEMTKRKRLQIW